MTRNARAIVVALCALWLTAGAAGDPADQLPNPAQEGRARHLFQEIRCLVCQNESIDDSEAQLADDLRRIVREQIRSGRTDTEVRAFLVARYGKFVLLKPPFDAGTALLWLGPFGVLAAAAVIVWRRRSRGIAADEPPLTPEELEKLRRLRSS